VHAKLGLVIRAENGKNKTYAYISTGNFHEKTAKIYSDIGLFTVDKRITKECVRLFRVLETKKFENVNFQHLLVGQFNLNEQLDSLLSGVVAAAQRGEKSEILLKLNSLQDDGMIQQLYKASQAGVKITLIIRGICSLVSGMHEFSENIDSFSIVDRYLEHARIFIFKTEQKSRYFISSADWMYRNLHRRIEIITPVYDKEIQGQLDELMNIQTKDNVKARSLNHGQLNEYRVTDAELVTQSQIESYYYIKRVNENL
jgi:polyphosphate kinase